MGRGKRNSRRESALQLRPGPDLGRLLDEFAAAHNRSRNDACKELLSLAVTDLDRRYYTLLRQMADAMGGVHAFPRACVHVQNALAGAALATGNTCWPEPERLRLILEVVTAFLASRGIQAQVEGLSPAAPASDPPFDSS